VTQSGDSLIAFPKKTAILMIQDIVRGDGYKAEVNSLNSKINKLNTQIQLQDSITTTLKNKCENYEFTIDKYFIMNETNKGTIKDFYEIRLISNFHSGWKLKLGISNKIASSIEENTPPCEDVIIYKHIVEYIAI
jgi:hypothetical protein